MASHSKSIRLKKALLGLPYEERLVPKITMDDVLSRWDSLCRSGYTPMAVCRIANQDRIDDAVYRRLMSSLNGYL
ncbi:MAG: hypothetical protein MI802_07220 [Desulfobacterales bacterium]|nr:hypothetical protein [Desulfobacterales bacterium]